MANENSVRSHSERVRQVKKDLPKPPFNIKRISFWNREAFVQVLLLIDICALLETNLKYTTNMLPQTSTGADLKARNIKRLTALIGLFRSVIDACNIALLDRFYTLVRRAIPERDLMAAAANPMKNFGVLQEIAFKIYDAISKSTIDAIKDSDLWEINKAAADKNHAEMEQVEEDFKNNMLTLNGLGSDDADNSVDIPSVMDSVKSAVDDVVKPKAKTTPNNNQNLF